MKWIISLVMLNLAVLIYFNLDLITPKQTITFQPINPEKLKILTQQELSALPKKVKTESTDLTVVDNTVNEAKSCYEWGSFTANNLPAAQVALVKLNLKNVTQQTTTIVNDRRFWIYYPPLKSAQLAQLKAAELSSLGVTELFVVQDSQWRNAISFGLFQDEQLATNLLNDLQTKGVKGVTKALRNPGKNNLSLLITEVGTQAAFELQKITPEFLGTELKLSACPA